MNGRAASCGTGGVRVWSACDEIEGGDGGRVGNVDGAGGGLGGGGGLVGGGGGVGGAGGGRSRGGDGGLERLSFALSTICGGNGLD